MIKLVYTGVFLLFSYALLFFSNGENADQCKYEITGVVKTHTDANGVSLTIHTADNQVFVPVQLSEDVILASGSKVKICYDKVADHDGQHDIKVFAVTYLP
jgi:hypothetical protein